MDRLETYYIPQDYWNHASLNISCEKLTSVFLAEWESACLQMLSSMLDMNSIHVTPSSQWPTSTCQPALGVWSTACHPHTVVAWNCLDITTPVTHTWPVCIKAADSWYFVLIIVRSDHFHAEIVQCHPVTMKRSIKGRFKKNKGDPSYQWTVSGWKKKSEIHWDTIWDPLFN